MDKKPTGKTIVLEGNGQRPSHHGDGYKEADIMYTLNATEMHTVAYEVDTTHDASEKRMRHRRPVLYQNVVGTIDACITKGTSNQLVAQNMFIVEGYFE